MSSPTIRISLTRLRSAELMPFKPSEPGVSLCFYVHPYKLYLFPFVFHVMFCFTVITLALLSSVFLRIHYFISVSITLFLVSFFFLAFFFSSANLFKLLSPFSSFSFIDFQTPSLCMQLGPSCVSVTVRVNVHVYMCVCVDFFFFWHTAATVSIAHCTQRTRASKKKGWGGEKRGMHWIATNPQSSTVRMGWAFLDWSCYNEKYGWGVGGTAMKSLGTTVYYQNSSGIWTSGWGAGGGAREERRMTELMELTEQGSTNRIFGRICEGDVWQNVG